MGVLSPLQTAGHQRVSGTKVFGLGVLCITLMVAHRPVGGTPQCPPGGTWFDKHVGANGRRACCIEICEPKGAFPEMCQRKCPDYEGSKARAATPTTTTADPSGPEAEVDQQINSAQQHGPFNSAFLYALIPVAIAIVGGIVAFKSRTWIRKVLCVFTSNKTADPIGLEGRREQGGGEAAEAGGGEEAAVAEAAAAGGAAAAAAAAAAAGVRRNGDAAGEGARGGDDARAPLLASDACRQDALRRQPEGGRPGNASLSTSRDRFPDQTAKEDVNKLPVPVQDGTCGNSVHALHC